MIRFPTENEEMADLHLCSFGITEVLTGVLVGSLGVGAETAAIVAPALLGAGTGALVSGVTGGNPLYGALGGALTGGLTGAFGGAGGALDEATGGVLGGTGSDALIGATVGAGSSALQGGNPLTGALTGGAGGALTGSGLLGGSSEPSAGAGEGGGTASAASTAAPASIGGDFSAGAGGAGGDVTAGVDMFGTNNLGTGGITSSLPSSGASTGGGDLGGGSDLGAGGGGSGLDGNITSSLGGGSGSSGGTPGAGESPITPLTPATGPISAPSVTGSDIGIPSLSGDAGGGGSGVLSYLGKNPGLAIGALGLGYEALQGNQPVAGQAQLQGQANQLNAQSKTLENYLQTGTLPPGLQASINQGSQAAKAQVRSQYAAMGLTGSSAEDSALASIDQTAESQGATYAMQLLQQGVNESELSSQIYAQLMQVQLSQDQNLSNAIGSFAIAAGGGVPRLSSGGG